MESHDARPHDADLCDVWVTVHDVLKVDAASVWPTIARLLRDRHGDSPLPRDLVGYCEAHWRLLTKRIESYNEMYEAAMKTGGQSESEIYETAQRAFAKSKAHHSMGSTIHECWEIVRVSPTFSMDRRRRKRAAGDGALEWKPEMDKALCVAWKAQDEADPEPPAGIPHLLERFWKGVSKRVRASFPAIPVNWRLYELRWRVIKHSLQHYRECLSRARTTIQPRHANDRGKLHKQALEYYLHTFKRAFEFLHCWHIVGDDHRENRKPEAVPRPPKRRRTEPVEETTEREDVSIASILRDEDESPDIDSEGDESGQNAFQSELLAVKRRAVAAAEDKNELLEMQIGMMFFSQPLPDDEEGKKYYLLTRKRLLDRAEKKAREEHDPNQ